MHLNDITGGITTALNGAGVKAKREAILWGACAFCGVAAVVISTSASIMALEPHVGTVYARLIVAGVFVAIALVIVISSKLSRPAQPARATIALDARVEAPPRKAQFAQIAMIIEAVMLGYSMSRRDRR